jgi:hypothetical protein
VSFRSNDPPREVQADGAGRVRIEGVSPGLVEAHAYTDQGKGVYVGLSGDADLPADGDVELAITLRPAADPALGIAVNFIGYPERSVDGSSLSLYIGVLYVPGNRYIDAVAQGRFELILDDCQPDPGNDGATPEADCVEGAAGFDAPYIVANGGRPLELGRLQPQARVAQPYAVALLLDQSRRIQQADPLDARLDHLRYFLSSLGAGNRVALTAFAADDQAGVDLSLLAEKPVTFYPVQSPGLGSPDEILLGAVDSLGSLEGGATPLLESFAQVRQFLGDDASVPVGTARWLVVLADGRDDTCGDRVSCLASLRSAADGVTGGAVNVLTIGLQSAADQGDQRDLSRLTEYSGVSLWVKDPTQLGIVFDRLGGVLDGTAPIQSALFLLESPVPGAFQSGGTVRGKLRFESCPFECSTMEVPVSVRIP